MSLVVNEIIVKRFVVIHIVLSFGVQVQPEQLTHAIIIIIIINHFLDIVHLRL